MVSAQDFVLAYCCPVASLYVFRLVSARTPLFGKRGNPQIALLGQAHLLNFCLRLGRRPFVQLRKLELYTSLFIFFGELELKVKTAMGVPWERQLESHI